MSSANAVTEKPDKAQPKTGRRLMLAAVVLLAGAVVVLIAGVVLMQDEIGSLRSTLEEVQPLKDGVTENQDKAKISLLAQRGIARGQETREKRVRLARSQQGKCEPVTLPLCQNMPYTVARYPNLLNHQTQDEAKAAIDASKFGRLLKSRCSSVMVPLLCSVLAPPCNGTQKPVLPCKELCKRATRDCRNELKRLRIILDPAMKCRRLPKEGVSQCFNGSWPKNTSATECTSMALTHCITHNKTLPPWRTRFPNYFGHVNKRDARAGFSRFNVLFSVARQQCSSVLAHFLCPMYAPPCTGTKALLPPCRELCLQVRTQCKRSIKQVNKGNGFHWPKDLKCKNFPREDEAACYMGPSTQVPATMRPSLGTRSPTLGKCQVVTIPLCKSVPYNMTEFPNFLQHRTQDEASLEVHQFKPLVRVNCSADLAFFLCSLYAPLCSVHLKKPPLPCRALCSRVRSGCEPLLVKFGFSWPERMTCELFPERLNDPTCLDTPNGDRVTTQAPLPTRAGRCEPLTVTSCNGLHYKMTSVPNTFKHKTQDKAALEISKFNPLIQTDCSSELNFFLCSLYVPRCSPYKALPCKEFCVRVRKSCLLQRRELKLKWPMSCSKLPTKAESPQCIDGLPATNIPKTTTYTVGRCEALTIPLCHGLHYNMTRFPNFINHTTQEMAAVEVHQFVPLLNFGCSSYLAQFLCSVYAPSCSGPPQPCRELCNRARKGCSPVLREFGITWPHNLACDKFPAAGNGTVCH